MSSISAEERTALRDSFRRLMADRCTEADIRRVMETPSGYDPALWRQLAAMGITGLLIDPAYGGSGAGPIELEMIMEEAGAALLGAPLLASAVLAAGVLAASDDQASKARLLPGIADGSRIATLAVTGPRGCWTPEGVAVAASGGRLNGEAAYVIDAQNADTLLVVARTDDGIGVFEVTPDASGLVVTPQRSFDHTLRLAQLNFVQTPARRIGTCGWDAVAQAMDLALVALAGEQAGGARRVLDFTVDYAKTRIQFGRAIGSFQAIKHMAANLLLETESAISAARHAANALANGAADAAAAISLAAFACADAYVTVTADAIQMHGGIAFTWVHPAHLYLRRARADAQLFGTSSYHRERYLQALEARQ